MLFKVCYLHNGYIQFQEHNTVYIIINVTHAITIFICTDTLTPSVDFPILSDGHRVAGIAARRHSSDLDAIQRVETMGRPQVGPPYWLDCTTHRGKADTFQHNIQRQGRHLSAQHTQATGKAHTFQHFLSMCAFFSLL